MRVEPVPGSPAATAPYGDERALLLADYHAGIEAGLRYERGVELESAAAERRERVLSLLERTDADRLVVLGDLGHRIGGSADEERAEISTLLDSISVPVTLVRGNHDAEAPESYDDRIEVTPPAGVRVGALGLAHGHTWPAPDVLSADVLCVGHEHPTVRLQDDVGGTRVERAWLRGDADEATFVGGVEGGDEITWNDPELVVFPAFNDRSGGTWVNVEGQSFLSPFLPDGLVGGQAYLLDGTRLGDYRWV